MLIFKASIIKFPSSLEFFIDRVAFKTIIEKNSSQKIGEKQTRDLFSLHWIAYFRKGMLNK